MKYVDLWTCEHGSKIWGMFKEGSDHDWSTVRVCSTEDLLCGHKLPDSWPQVKYIGFDGIEIDHSYIEIGHLIGLLLKGSCNHIWQTTSPVVISGNPLLDELREIVKNNPSKAPYKSIRGMATSQKLDETKRPRLAGGKGYRTAARTALFGVDLLTSWTFNFAPKSSIVNLEIPLEEVDASIAMLDEAYENSPFPDKPNEEPFRYFLYKVRKMEESGEI